MSEEQFEALVRLIGAMAHHAAGNATHQRRAGNLQEDIEDARTILVDDL